MIPNYSWKPGPRQHDVLVRIANGYTVDQAAESLWIGKSTVKTHLTVMRERADVNNNAALVHAAWINGWLSVNDVFN